VRGLKIDCGGLLRVYLPPQSLKTGILVWVFCTPGQVWMVLSAI